MPRAVIAVLAVALSTGSSRGSELRTSSARGARTVRAGSAGWRCCSPPCRCPAAVAASSSRARFSRRIPWTPQVAASRCPWAMRSRRTRSTCTATAIDRGFPWLPNICSSAVHDLAAVLTWVTRARPVLERAGRPPFEPLDGGALLHRLPAARARCRGAPQGRSATRRVSP